MATQTLPGLQDTSAPQVVEKIRVRVDGRDVEVPKTMPDPLTGRPAPTTMLQACAAVKVDVPHYCYHPKLPVSGNCRMCLVEFGTPAVGADRKPILNPDGTPKIAKSARPAIACATPISPGMEIYTATPAVRQMRQAVLEFLLINHPLDCPICDQAGECKLQEYSVDYGHAESRFVEPKVHKPKRVDLGPRIMLDDERCILCSRCIRFTRDIVGDDALGIINRGSYSTLTAHPGRAFDNNYTLNTVDICPVGALTSKDFRFKMRVWFLKETKSVCASCATGCNIIVGSRERTVFRYEPRQNDAVNSCWMCDYGRLNYKWINQPDRLLRPRLGGSETSDWDAVIREVRARLACIPKASLAIIASARQTNEELFLLAKLAKHFDAITDIVPRIGEGDKLLVSADRNPNTAGARMAGIAAQPPGSMIPRIAESIGAGRIQHLIIVGEDVVKHGISRDLLAKLRTLIVCDILPNETTAAAHVLLPGCAHVEKRGTFTNVKGRVQKFLKAIEPPGEARSEVDVLSEIVFSTINAPAPRSIEGIFDLMASETPAMVGISWAKLGDLGMDVQL